MTMYSNSYAMNVTNLMYEVFIKFDEYYGLESVKISDNDWQFMPVRIDAIICNYLMLFTFINCNTL
jgi:hypothetical protein